ESRQPVVAEAIAHTDAAAPIGRIAAETLQLVRRDAPLREIELIRSIDELFDTAHAGRTDGVKDTANGTLAQELFRLPGTAADEFALRGGFRFENLVSREAATIGPAHRDAQPLRKSRQQFLA